MRSRLHRGFAASAMTIALVGCVQATRHSNTMVFGTNTTFGVKVGANTGEVPEVVVGYDRQEAVIMPLVANTGSILNPNMLTPCDLTEPLTLRGGTQYAVHPCSLVASNRGVQDSYSVLASFGASYDAGGTGAKGGLAQYFATGVAAQILALKGGAALVATGDAAKASAQTDADQGVAALITGNTNFSEGFKDGVEAAAIHTQIESKIRATSKENLATRLAAFDSALGVSTGAVALCTNFDPNACADRIGSLTHYGDVLMDEAVRDSAVTALSGWTTP